MTPEETSKKMLEQILPLLKEGQTVEIRPQGTSMFPLLTEGRDSVILQALGNTMPKRGDLLLYQRNSGLLVLHRVCRFQKDGCYFVGDNQTDVEGPLALTQILAKVTHIRRKNRLFSVKHPVYLLISRIWLFLRPIRPYISRPLGMLWRTIRHNM
ncbi:hypothetical protein D7V86_24325 [bacterium D16-51]|nr:hypothetical protein D7V96_03670 [bacterium D16-59]RKI54030.1 hypothetical protein D7V86_24325 [bacterium D16-51]